MTTDLTFEAPAPTRRDPLPFKLAGYLVSKPADDPDARWELELHAKPVLPGAILDGVMGSVTIEDGEVTGFNQAAALPLLRKIIVKDDLAAFEELVNDDDRAVDITTLWAAAMKLIETLSGGRPTGGSGA